MKLHLSANTGQNMFTGYGAGYVTVNRVQYESNLIVLPDRIIEDWDVESFELLAPEHFHFLLTLQPEMVLFGTGGILRFPHPKLTRALIESNIGVEVMDTSAACRTYNILTDEGRRVAAALLIQV
ncbi:MAG TPA: Mth938-like domain-containing protein [Nitrosospira sp.]